MSYYETTYCGFRDVLSRWLSGSHKLPPVSGKSEPVNSAEVIKMEFKLPGFKNKKDVTDSSVRLKKKILHYRREWIVFINSWYRRHVNWWAVFTCIKCSITLKTTVVDAYLIDKVTGVAELWLLLKKKIFLKTKPLPDILHPVYKTSWRL